MKTQKAAVLLILTAVLCAPAMGAYYLKINGQQVTEYTMTVGSSVTIEVWSDSAAPMSVEPTALSEYLEDGYHIIAWKSGLDAPEAFTHLVVNPAAGESASGWTISSPYQNQAVVGFTLGYPNGQPVAAGKWWQVTYTALSAGDRTIGLGSYTPGFTEFRNAQYITIHQVSDQPAPQNDLDLFGFVSTWLYSLGDPYFDSQFDLVKDDVINLADFAAFVRLLENTFYVSTADGDDTNDGSLHSPFATILKAKDVVRNKIAGGMNGDVTVNIRGGTYLLDSALTFSALDSGKDGYKVIYKGYKNEMPQISAAEALTGWQPDTGNVYKVNIGTQWKPQTLFENGQWAQKARTPNTGYFNADTGTDGSRTLVYRAGDVSAFNIADATVQVWPGAHLWEGNWNMNYDWVSDINPVSSANWGTRTLMLGADATYPMTVNNRYYLQGSKDFLDAPGEWHHDTASGWLYYYPYSTPIENQQILAAKSQRLLQVFGSVTTKVKDITFESLHFSISDGLRQYKPWWGDDWNGMLYVRNAEKIVFNKCHISNAGIAGVCLYEYVQNCQINNCLIEDNGIFGIVAKGLWPGTAGYTHPDQLYINKNNRIHNNYIRNSGKLVASGNGIWMYQSGDNIITNNKIENMPRLGIHYYSSDFQGLINTTLYGNPPQIYGIPVTWENRLIFCHTRNNYIAYNEFVNCMYDSQDGGAIYTYGTGADNVIENNFVHDMTGLPGGALSGIYMDDASNFTTIRKNVVTRLTDALDIYPYICKGQANLFENNIAVNNTTRNPVMVMQTPINPDPDYQEPTIDNEFARNIFHQVGGEYVYQVSRLPWLDTYFNQMVASSDYNVFYHTSGLYKCYKEWRTSMTWAQWQSFGYDANSATGQDPLFTDIANDNYTLQPNSPALSRGFEQIDLSGVGLTEDYPF